MTKFSIIVTEEQIEAIEYGAEALEVDDPASADLLWEILANLSPEMKGKIAGVPADFFVIDDCVTKVALEVDEDQGNENAGKTLGPN